MTDPDITAFFVIDPVLRSKHEHQCYTYGEKQGGLSLDGKAHTWWGDTQCLETCKGRTGFTHDTGKCTHNNKEHKRCLQ